jgi:type II secretion system protein G
MSRFRAAYSYPEKRLGVKKLKQNQKGFTLIELLVVIAIIGLLASVVLLALNSARSKSRDAKRVADIRQIQSALELYYNDCNIYPDAQGTGAAAVPDPDDTANCPAGTAFQDLMAQYPENPQHSNDGTCAASVTNYTQDSAGAGYSVKFCLGGTTGGLSANADGQAYYARETGITEEAE